VVQSLAALLDRLGHRAVVTRGRQQLHVALGHFQQRLFYAIALDDLAVLDLGANARW